MKLNDHMKKGILIFFIVICIALPGNAQETFDNNDLAGQLTAIQDILSSELPQIAKTLETRLGHIQESLDQLLAPRWEYKIVIPNLMNTQDSQEQVILDGVNFNQLGLEGWELINYSANYGFVFKRRTK